MSNNGRCGWEEVSTHEALLLATEEVEKCRLTEVFDFACGACVEESWAAGVLAVHE